MDYYFVINGPAALVPVHVLANGSAMTSAIPPGGYEDNAHAEFSVGVDSGPTSGTLNVGAVVNIAAVSPNFYDYVSTSGNVTGSLATGFAGAFNIDDTYLAETDRVYHVHLNTFVVGYLSGQYGGGDLNPSALVGSLFSIGLSDPNEASRYQIVTSDGIGNSDSNPPPPPVPDEASVGLLVLLSFSLVAGLARKRSASC